MKEYGAIVYRLSFVDDDGELVVQYISGTERQETFKRAYRMLDELQKNGHPYDAELEEL